jgi:hypothetical protein
MQRRGVNGSHGPDVAREADMKEGRLNGGLRVSCARQRCRATADGKQLTISDPLQAPSAGLAIPAAISFASFAQFVLVEAGLSQFGTRIPPNWSLAGLPVSAAISLAPLAEHVLTFAGTPQLLAFPASHTDASRSNLKGLGKGRDRNYKKSSCRCGAEHKFSHSLQHS